MAMMLASDDEEIGAKNNALTLMGEPAGIASILYSSSLTKYHLKATNRRLVSLSVKWGRNIIDAPASEIREHAFEMSFE